VTVLKPKDKPLTSLSNDIHLTILKKLFTSTLSVKYTDLVDLLMQAYATEGYKRGTNGVKDLLKAMMNKKIVTHDKDGYNFHPEILDVDD
jgi:hypothetical protein